MNPIVPFAYRPPSVAWERVSVARIPGLELHAWFRPAPLPYGLSIMLPEGWVGNGQVLPISLQDALFAVGISQLEFQSAALYGQEWQPASILYPWLNHPLPGIPAGAKPEILICAVPVASPVPTVFPQQALFHPGFAQAPMNGSFQPLSSVSAMASDGTDSVADTDLAPEYRDEFDDFDSGQPLSEPMMFARMEAAWKSSLQLERQMTGLRQKLSTMMVALGKLDRELTPDERLASDREDRDEWNDARRWLRDLQAKCHREVKAFDIGMTSGAGHRHRLEHLVQTIVEPKRNDGSLDSHRQEFEKYRKDLVSLQRAMTSAIQSGSMNGTQRAQRVLGKIAGKIRQMRVRNREAIGGTNLDKSCRRKS